jgi:hypothetical protein
MATFTAKRKIVKEAGKVRDARFRLLQGLGLHRRRRNAGRRALDSPRRLARASAVDGRSGAACARCSPAARAPPFARTPVARAQRLTRPAASARSPGARRVRGVGGAGAV